MQAFWGRYNFYLTYFPLVIGIATAFVYFEQNVTAHKVSTC